VFIAGGDSVGFAATYIVVVPWEKILKVSLLSSIIFPEVRNSPSFQRRIDHGHFFIELHAWRHAESGTFAMFIHEKIAATNAALALELRSTIDGILHQLDEILDKYKDPYELALVQEQFFEELGSDLKQTFASVRWYRFFEFWLGLPSKNDVRAAIEKLSEMTRCLRSAMPDGRFDLERRAQAPTLGREVKELLKRRRSPS